MVACRSISLRLQLRFSAGEQISAVKLYLVTSASDSEPLSRPEIE